MKVTNLDLQPNRTFRMRKMELDSQAAMRALVHRGTQEAVLVEEEDVKFHPATVTLESWQNLVTYPDPEEETPKKVSAWAWLTGDNPLLMLSSAGNPFPIPDDPEKSGSYESYRRAYTECYQAAVHSRGINAATRERMGLIIQGILAGVCAIGAVVTAAALLPRILERF